MGNKDDSRPIPYIGSRLAGAWANHHHADFRNGKEAPADVANESDAGLAEAMQFLERVGPTLKGSDWSGSGWVGRGRKGR